MKRFITLYWPSYPRQITYMLQMSNYDLSAFWQWWFRVKDFRNVNIRRDLDLTKRAKALLIFVYGLTFLMLGMAISIGVASLNSDNLWLPLFSWIVFLLYPFAVTLLTVLFIWISKKIIIDPKDRRLINQSAGIYARHPGKIIAVAGSYGKTTMKEVLATVLAEGGKTAATPGNKNVAISHAVFAKKLTGDEKFVIVEFGEGYKGDVAKFSKTVQPDIGIITGLAPNHLDKYGSLQNLKKDLLSLAEYLDGKNVYLCADNSSLSKEKSGKHYDSKGTLGWKVSNVKNTINGLAFEMKKGKEKISVKSQLVGRHLVATLSLVVALASELGLTIAEIEKGIAKTKPFEHRLEPRHQHGAWIIDDAYNGSIEGMRAGLNLLSELETKGRKIYITPGLVDQGEETQSVHQELGQLIADAKPDEVVLMKNSATGIIKNSLESTGFEGKITEISDPLSYYQNLDTVLAAGDIALLQNDWTDNYA